MENSTWSDKSCDITSVVCDHWFLNLLVSVCEHWFCNLSFSGWDSLLLIASSLFLGPAKCKNHHATSAVCPSQDFQMVQKSWRKNKWWILMGFPLVIFVGPWFFHLLRDAPEDNPYIVHGDSWKILGVGWKFYLTKLLCLSTWWTFLTSNKNTSQDMMTGKRCRLKLLNLESFRLGCLKFAWFSSLLLRWCPSCCKQHLRNTTWCSHPLVLVAHMLHVQLAWCRKITRLC